MNARNIAVALVVVAASCAGTAAATSAYASSGCPATAKLTSGHLSQVVYDKTTGLANGTSPYHHKYMGRLTNYVATTAVSFTFGGNKYIAAPASSFVLGCYGQNARTPSVLYPKVFLNNGTMGVSTVAGTPGGIQTREALMNPVGHVAQRLHVQRAATTSGKATMTLTSTGPTADFTPELGPTAGHCIYHHDITAHSYWSSKISYFTMSIHVVS